MKESTHRLERIAGMAAVIILVAGCVLVLYPFITSILWAAILCFATRPLYRRLERWLGGRRNLASLCMVMMVTLVLVVPFLLVGVGLTENLAGINGSVREILQKGLPPAPAWLAKIPVAGGYVTMWWSENAGDPERIGLLLKGLLQKSHNLLLAFGMDLGRGIVQLLLSIFVAFFFYRAGESVVGTVTAGFRRIVGDHTTRYLEVVGKTVRSVVYGILGTALAQGIVAGLGFWIAGVPSPLFLGLITFFLALIIPGGPPIIWVPAMLWLFCVRSTGWGVFMLIYGAVVISGVDNVIRPYLISRGTDLPFVLVMFGVVGGMLAFGFIGFFLGPVLLAMGYCLLREWLEVKKAGVAEAPVPAPAGPSGDAPSPPP